MRRTHGANAAERPGRRQRPSGRPAFTLIQALVALGILATLAGILLGSMAAIKRAILRGADTQTLSAISTGMSAFVTSFDIAPPLVRDQSKTPKTIDKITNASNVEVSVIAVYSPAVTADATFLRGGGFTISDMNNPLADSDRDLRYSLDSLGFYLLGVLDAPVRSDAPDVPIDLVPGPGTGRPDLTGGFGKGRFGPFVDAAGKSVRVSRSDDQTMPTAEVTDRNGVPLRYYRWLKNKTVTKWEDLNLPPMVVGPDYGKFHSDTPASQRQQPDARVTGANWAIVMAGPNRVFGDEPRDTIISALRVYEGASVDPDMSDAALRARAWADNLVEVGSATN